MKTNFVGATVLSSLIFVSCVSVTQRVQDIANGDKDALKAYIDSGEPIDQLFEREGCFSSTPNGEYLKCKQTLLQRAAEAGSEEIVATLLRNGASANAFDNRGRNALFYVFRTKKEKDKKAARCNLISLLVSHGADPNNSDTRGFTVLLAALSQMSFEAKTEEEKEEFRRSIVCLVDQGARIDYAKGRTTAPLGAAASRDIKMAEVLLDKGANVNFRDNSGDTPLISVITHPLARERTKAVLLLIRRGADVNAQNSRGMTALMYAAKDGDGDLFEILVENGADIRAQNSEGETLSDLLPGKVKHRGIEIPAATFLLDFAKREQHKVQEEIRRH